MPSFCLIQNDNTKESFLWVGNNRIEGKWFKEQNESFIDLKAFTEILRNSDDPEGVIRELAKHYKKKSD